MDLPLFERAAYFSMGAHGAMAQLRGITRRPYFTHTWSVAATVTDWNGSEEQIAAAYLHDVFEDTKITPDYLSMAFSADVVNMVVDLTNVYTRKNYPDESRAWRKEQEASRISELSQCVLLVKLADIRDNLLDIIKHGAEGKLKTSFVEKRLNEKAYVISLIQQRELTDERLIKALSQVKALIGA
jgi:(p)ppGpp synthase/HD superfamily hydrolase